MLPTPPRGLKSKKEGHFRGQEIKFDREMLKYENRFFSTNATLKSLDGTTSYTLYQPWVRLLWLRALHSHSLAEKDKLNINERKQKLICYT